MLLFCGGGAHHHAEGVEGLEELQGLAVRGVEHAALHVENHGRGVLRGVGGPLGELLAVGVAGAHEAVLTSGRCAVRNAQIGVDIVQDVALHKAVLGLGYGDVVTHKQALTAVAALFLAA